MSTVDVQVAIALIIFTCIFQILDLLQRRKRARLDQEGRRIIALHSQLSKEYELRIRHNLKLVEKFEEDLNHSLAHHREDLNKQLQKIVEEEIAEYRRMTFVRRHMILGGN